MSLSYEVEGKISKIGETETFGSGFEKRSVVLVVKDNKYENDLAVDFVKDKCSVLDAYSKGETVVVSFNLRSNEHNGKYYTNATGWRIQKADGSQESAGSGASSEDEDDDNPPF